MHPRVLIVGGGIGGLTLAAALARQGVVPDLIERAPAWAPVGAGIGLGPNAVRALGELDAANEVMSVGMTSMFWDLTDMHGRVLNRFDFRPLHDRLGVTMACLHRARLHQILLDRASDARIRLGTTVTTLAADGRGVDVVFSDGASRRYDVVVGSDGIRSQVRDLVFGPATIRYAGYTSQRIVVERPDGIDRAIEMWGRGRRVGLCPIDEEHLYCYALRNAPPGALDPEDTCVERFHERFGTFDGFMRDVLRQVESPDQLFPTDLEEVRGQAWRRGRVVLLGDAAHAMTPDLGQGGAMAIEDAICLATCVRTSESVDDALAAYVGKRMSVATKAQRRSRTFGRVGQLENGLVCRVRNLAVRALPNRRVANLR